MENSKYSTAHKFIKFLFVGGVNTVFGYSIFALFLFLGMHYAVATLFATILGILFNFKTTGVIVFNNKDNRADLQILRRLCSYIFYST